MAEPLDFGSGSLNGTPDSGNDLFVAKFQANGSPVWSRRFTGSGAEDGRAIATDQSGHVLIVGTFTDELDFGLGALKNPGGNAGFLSQFAP